MRRKPLDSNAAQAVAIQALTFLGAAPERLERFLDAAGLRPDMLRAAAKAPEFWAGVLDHLAADETLLIGFAEEARLSPDEVMAARHVLSPVME